MRYQTLRAFTDGESKSCTRCKDWLPLTAFYRQKSHSTGRNSWCVGCVMDARDQRLSAPGRDADVPKVVSKICRVCQKPHPASRFYRHPQTIDRLSKVCKGCHKKEWSDTSPKYRDKRRAWIVKTYVWRLVCQAKLRSAKEGFGFDLEKDDLILPEYCPVLGIRLVIAPGKPADASPTLDRKNPSLGYVKGNVYVISWLANRLKSNCEDPEVFEKIAKYLRGGPDYDIRRS